MVYIRNCRNQKCLLCCNQIILKNFEIIGKKLDFGGETGIRTLGRLPFNGFQDRRIRPLCHLSDRREYYRNPCAFAIKFFLFTKKLLMIQLELTLITRIIIKKDNIIFSLKLHNKFIVIFFKITTVLILN